MFFLSLSLLSSLSALWSVAFLPHQMPAQVKTTLLYIPLLLYPNIIPTSSFRFLCLPTPRPQPMKLFNVNFIMIFDRWYFKYFGFLSFFCFFVCFFFLFICSLKLKWSVFRCNFTECKIVRVIYVIILLKCWVGRF